MKKSLLAILATSVFSLNAIAGVSVGAPAPDFALTDLNGKAVKLSDFKGKHVVLEWHNPACPFVVKHYDSGNMPGLQVKYDAKDTVWLAVNSTNRDHQDYRNNDKMKAYLGEKKSSPDFYLPDLDGKVGKNYGAKTTPHMYVINPAGTLVYAGAIDDKPSTQQADIKTAHNYLVAALDESRGGKPVSKTTSIPYGCSVKYR